MCVVSREIDSELQLQAHNSRLIAGNPLRPFSSGWQEANLLFVVVSPRGSKMFWLSFAFSVSRAFEQDAQLVR